MINFFKKLFGLKYKRYFIISYTFRNADGTVFLGSSAILHRKGFPSLDGIESYLSIVETNDIVKNSINILNIIEINKSDYFDFNKKTDDGRQP